MFRPGVLFRLLQIVFIRRQVLADVIFYVYLSMKRPALTLEKFIQKSTAIHGDSFDYSKVEVVSAKGKVEIICRLHGSFFQSPDNHYGKGRGCKQCANEKLRQERAMSQQDFIDRANLIHNNIYDYSELNYVNSFTKVTISCPLHGAFLQIPRDHVNQKSGCLKCKGAKISIKKTLHTTASFIANAKGIHGDKYDYSQTVYKNVKQQLTIICPTHGPFQMEPDKHIHQKAGCQKCGKVYRRSAEEFLKDVNVVHNHKYSYTKSLFKGVSTCVIITCPIHGDFSQKTANHLRGDGCPLCAKESMHGYHRSRWILLQKKRMATLYLIRLTSTTTGEVFHKLGITFRNTTIRFSGEPFTVHILYGAKSMDAGLIWDLEKTLIRVLASKKYNPSFAFPGQSECFQFIDTNKTIRQIITSAIELREKSAESIFSVNEVGQTALIA